MDDYNKFLVKEKEKHEFLVNMKREIVEEKIKRAVLFDAMAVAYLSNCSDNNAVLEVLNHREDWSEKNSRNVIEDEQDDVAGGKAFEFFEEGANTYDYIRDSDVEEYLKGLLWVLKMYSDGVCPDVGYSFACRTVPSPSRIVRYFLAHTDDVLFGNKSYMSGKDQPASTIRWLAQQIRVPTTNASSLSAEATAVCVIPPEGHLFVSSNLKTRWGRFQNLLLSKPDKSNLNSMSYTELIAHLKALWSLPAIPSMIKKSKEPTDPMTRMKNQRRIPNGLRKERGKERHASKMNSIGINVATEKSTKSGLYDFYADQTLHDESKMKTGFFSDQEIEITARPIDESWTVVRRAAANTTRGVASKTSPYQVKYSLPSPFKLPAISAATEVVDIQFSRSTTGSL